MRGILIDAARHEVREVETLANLEEIRFLIGCEWVTCAGYWNPEFDLWCDDEGLLNGDSDAFTIPLPVVPERGWNGDPQVFVGNAVLLGPVDKRGHSTSFTGTLDSIRQRVRFGKISPEKARELARYDVKAFETVDELMKATYRD